ncbi:MAG: M10 family metallopeptidase C-terminal domain-containing protein [Hyphomicrobiaceae bacterium]|nr:M10 family metallopeptidase C-terminal domain-containing protein [Hyphomicrobiaceae bacterium]MCC0024338.1 M10 family metallopeptidase C-terminal domain-containing protein [Hyphomicrobiaceae bacterium]
MQTTPDIWQGRTRATDGAPPPGSARANGFETFQHIIALADGGFLVIWQDDCSYQAAVYNILGQQKSIIDLVDYWPDDALRPLDQAPVAIHLADGSIGIGVDGFVVENNVAVDRFGFVRIGGSGQVLSSQTLSTSLDYNKDGLQLTSLSDGGFVAGYHEASTGSNMFAFCRYSADGTPQLTSAPTADMLSGDLYTDLVVPGDTRPSVLKAPPVASAMLGFKSGGYLALWASGVLGNQTLFGRLFDADGHPETAAGSPGAGREFRVTAEGSGRDISDLQTIDLAGGGFALAFRDETGSGRQGLYVAAFDAAGSAAQSPDDILNAQSSDRDVASGYQLFALEGGGFGLIWREAGGNGGAARDRLKFQLFDDAGQPATGQVKLAAADSGALSVPSAVQLADGTLLFGWADDRQEQNLSARRYDLEGHAIGAIFAPFKAPDQSVNGPQFALLEDGRVAVSIDGGNRKTYFAILDPRDDLILGTGGDDRITARTEGGRISAKGGDDQLFGQAGKDVLIGGSGKDRLLGDRGADNLIGGAGNDFLKGGKGHDLFVFAKRGGNDLVADFRDGQDRLDLSGFHYKSATSALKHFSESGGANNHVITFEDRGTHIKIKGIDMHELDAADILI